MNFIVTITFTVDLKDVTCPLEFFDADITPLLLSINISFKVLSVVFSFNDKAETIFLLISASPISSIFLKIKLFGSLLLKIGWYPQAEIKNKKIILFGVSYALLDFVEKYPVKSKNLIIIETGGMKGRRKEITKEELYSKLEKGFHTDLIHSEYGMTELLSQAYSKNNGVFKTTNWLKVFNRNINNPFDVNSKGKGVLNFIDLANINSCSFIATDDIGEVFSNNSFKVLGRLNESDIRGCSLMFNQL